MKKVNKSDQELEIETVKIAEDNIKSSELSEPKYIGSGFRDVWQSHGTIWMKIPLIRNLYINKKLREGAIIAEIVFPNKHSRYYFVESKTKLFRIREGKVTRYFSTEKVKQDPGTYIRRIGRVPVVTWYWDYVNPLPVKPLKDGLDILDVEILANEFERIRSIQGAMPIEKFLNEWETKIKRIEMMVMFALGGLAIIAAKLFGFVKWGG